MPDTFKLGVTRDSLPLELDIQPDLRSGENLLIACPCRQTFSVPITEATAEFLALPPDDPSTQFVIELSEPISVPSTCESCCAFLVLRGRLLNLLDTSPRLSVHLLNEDSSTQRSWPARRWQVEQDGTFEAWFSEPADTCPPPEPFETTDRLELDVGVRSPDREFACRTRVEIDTLAPIVSVVDIGGPFPRTMVELEQDVVVNPCPPPSSD
jgi:hypothetical protein